MNVIKINEIPFKEKKDLLKASCLLYKKFKIFESIVMAKPEMNIRDKIEDLNRTNYRNISLFEHIIEMLSNDSKLIIKNEFIDCAEKEWWSGKWSKSTYYKKLLETMDNFLFLFYA